MICSKLLALWPMVGSAIATNHPPGKRGLASNDGLDLSGFENAPLRGQSKVRWQYNWDSDIGDNKLSFAEYVPMLHSLRHGHEIVWNDRVDKWLRQGTGHLLAFNEPDRPLPQAAMSVGDAVDAWWRYMEPYAGRARLGAPAVSNGGWGWITKFLDECQGCHVDYIPVHWYNPDSLEHDFEGWINLICSLGRPVWVTEFKGLGGSSQDEIAFLQEAMTFLEGNPCVERYAYFGTANNDLSLLSNEDSHLSELGSHYASD
ncbi:hypothetical protein ARSEF4850_008549 [Beauveria asiatica]